MRKLLFSVGILALIAAPALGQPEPPGSRGKAVLGHPQPAPQAAPHPAPQAPPQGGPGRGGPGGGHGFGEREHGRGGQPQAAQPAPAPQAAPPQSQERRGDYRGNRGDNRGNDYRGNPGNWDNNRNRFDNRGGDNRGGRPGYYGGQRHDFSNFRDFHRSFRAPRRFHAPQYRRPSGWYYRRWAFGDILPSMFWARDYWLDDYEDYDLPPPPYGAVWVRVGNDALLIDEDTGEVITVEYDVFY